MVSSPPLFCHLLRHRWWVIDDYILVRKHPFTSFFYLNNRFLHKSIIFVFLCYLTKYDVSFSRLVACSFYSNLQFWYSRDIQSKTSALSILQIRRHEYSSHINFVKFVCIFSFYNINLGIVYLFAYSTFRF